MSWHPPLYSYYRATCLDDGSYVDYALLRQWPSQCFWMIPGTWQEFL